MLSKNVRTFHVNIVADGKIKPWERTGNFHADRMARAGSLMHADFSPLIARYERAEKCAVLLCKYIGRIMV